MSLDDGGVKVRNGLALAAMLAMARPSAAREVCRAIAALPVTISEPGVHCLTADLRSELEEGVAVTVAADWVTLDLRGFELLGTGHQTTAIEASNRLGVTIRDGTIRGFSQGVRLSGKRGGYHLVERIRLVEIPGVALRIDGSHNTIRENLIGSPQDELATAGEVVVNGPLPRVLNNKLTRITGGVALEIGQGDGAVIEGNVLIGEEGASEATGVLLVSGSDVLLLRNELRDLGRGVVFGQAAGLYRGNFMQAVRQPYSGGTDADR